MKDGAKRRHTSDTTKNVAIYHHKLLTILWLAGLTERYMQCRLLKESVRTSNWESRVLSYEQQLYAATDAFASLRLYQV